MSLSRYAAGIVSIWGMVAVAPEAHGQPYPYKPIRFVR